MYYVFDVAEIMFQPVWITWSAVVCRNLSLVNAYKYPLVTPTESARVACQVTFVPDYSNANLCIMIS